MEIFLFSCKDSLKHPERNPFSSLPEICVTILSPTFLRKDLQSDVLSFLPELCVSSQEVFSSLELLVILKPQSWAGGRERGRNCI